MIQTIQNVADCQPLYLPHSLYLKPVAKVAISVPLPANVTTVSNYEVMEKIRQMVSPDKFSLLKVSKTTLEFIRFEAEIEDRSKLENCISRLSGRPIRLAGSTESVKIRASEKKDEFPSRHDWDSFFRDANNMDEMKAGERPDTIFLSNLPIKWFAPRHMVEKNMDNLKPSESIFKRIFEKFGDVRCVDIPICDPYRAQMKSHMSGIKTFTHDQENYFEGYVQFEEYVGFVRAMNEFRAMKLVRKEIDKNLTVNIHADFDKTKHLSDASIRRRKVVRDRLIAKDQAAEEDEKKRVQIEEEKKEKERKRLEALKEAEFSKQQERENKRKEKHLKKLREKETSDLSHKIRAEEKKLLKTQRKLESVRLVEALFERIRNKIDNGRQTSVKEEKGYEKRKNAINIKTEDNEPAPKLDLRNKLAKRYRNEQEKNYLVLQDRVKRVRDGTMLQNYFGTDKHRSADKGAGGVDSLSSFSEFSDLEENGTRGKKKKKHKRKTEVESSSDTSNSDEDDSDDSSSSSSSTESGEKKKKKEKKAKLVAGVVPPPYMAGYPPPGMFNPETGEMQMPMYPYAFYPPGGMAPMRGGYFPSGGYRGNNYRGPPRGRYPRIRNRGGPYRGRGGYNQYSGQYDDDEYYKYFKHKSGYNDDDGEGHDGHDRRRSYSRSRSRSRRRSRSRSHRRSYSRSTSRSRRKSYSQSRSRSKSKKLVSTLRKSNSHSWSRSHSRSPSRSRDKRRRHKSRSSWSREGSAKTDGSPRTKTVTLEPAKLMRTAKEIQRSVQIKLAERAQGEEELKQNQLEFEAEEMEKQFAENSPSNAKESNSNKRSTSVDSSKFRSPKRREKTESPEKEWN